MKTEHLLWYESPAEEWIEALPLGNGRMGAMVFGGTLNEKIQIDESGFWSGAPSDENNRPGTAQLRQDIIEALQQDDYEKADRLGHDFVGNKNQYGTNMPVGNLLLEITGGDGQAVSDYSRCLDMEHGLAVTEFSLGGSHYKRTAFISNPAQTAVVCFENTDGKAFDLNIRYDGIQNQVSVRGEEADGYRIEGDAWEPLHSDGKTGVHLLGLIRVVCDGTQSYEDGGIRIGQTARAVLYLDLETDLYERRGEPPIENQETRCRNRVGKAAERGYEALLNEHCTDVSEKYNRMSLTLSSGSEDDESVREQRSTEKRIESAAAGLRDLQLTAQMFQYGRYLLIASSREDSPLPTHMGGIWNDNIYNNIDCTQDMHIDMNLQMQYLLSAQTGLAECYQPLIRYITDILVPSGRKTAREAYGTDGFAAHIVSNPWGFTSLGWGYNWGVWSFGGVWCAAMLWDYYEYTGDQQFLKETAFPVIQEAVEFTADYVFYDETAGYYMTGPSYSPENQFSTSGKDYFLSLSPTCDIIMAREILNIYQKTLDLLGESCDGGLRQKTMEILEKLPPFKIGKKGQVQEWFEDFEEPIPNHRHTSHLLGVYPFKQMDLEDSSVRSAILRSIELRGEDFEITSWGMNMLMSYYARLGDGNKAEDVLMESFQRIVKKNLASVMSDETSMWCGTWELDGNTGITAAICEMLAQGDGYTIHILPALPESWSTGEVRGIGIKGGCTADIAWRDGRLSTLAITPITDGKRTVICQGNTIEIEMKAGERQTIVL